ncbi:MAG: hypothetical protein ACRD40_13835 [Candidatus Acidiferrales bacterium]
MPDVTPQQLMQGLAVVIADDTGCTRAWADHQEPLTREELAKCFASCVDVFRKCGLTITYDWEGNA